MSERCAASLTELQHEVCAVGPAGFPREVRRVAARVLLHGSPVCGMICKVIPQGEPHGRWQVQLVRVLQEEVLHGGLEEQQVHQTLGGYGALEVPHRDVVRWEQLGLHQVHDRKEAPRDLGAVARPLDDGVHLVDAVEWRRVALLRVHQHDGVLDGRDVQGTVVDREGVVDEGIAQGFRSRALLDVGGIHGGQVGS